MICVANWKMNGSIALVEAYKETRLDVIVCPPFTFLHHFRGFKLGAQNCSEHHNGSFTGEISAQMLKENDCSYVIVGHSERRSFETQNMVIEKAKRAIEQDMIPIICCEDYVEIDLDSSSYWLAYEPLWAIGTGKTPTPEQVYDMTNKLKQNCHTVLYGGSVNSKNKNSFKGTCDGFLIGGASLNIEEMILITSN